MNCKSTVFSSSQPAFALMCLLTVTLVSVCQADNPPTPDDVRQIEWGEREFLASPRKFLFEALAQRSDGNGMVQGDEYHFGRGGDEDWLRLSEFVPRHGSSGSSQRGKSALDTQGLLQMIVPDRAGVDQHYYDWKYEGEEFLGDIHCKVFDLRPSKGVGYGAFIGRIWVATPDLAIVRFEGTYTSKPKEGSHYVHFVSVRTKNALGFWYPSEVYAEESNLTKAIRGSRNLRVHIIIWDYRPVNATTTIRVLQEQDLVPIDDSTSSRDSVQRYHEIETNVVTWMEGHGLLAPVGKTEKVLETVVSNILATNQDVSYRWPIRVRVLLTEPLESFTIGDTIVLSKGLIDVIPDESTLALILTRELAHILLNHHIDTRFGYRDFFMRNEQEVLMDLTFERTPKEVSDADSRAIELFAKSPYKQKLSTAALFVHQVTQACANLPALFSPRFGNRLPGCGSPSPINRIEELASESSKQTGALPLYTRVDVDSWNNETSLLEPPQIEAPFQLIPVKLNPRKTSEEQAADPLLPPPPRAHVPAVAVRK